MNLKKIENNNVQRLNQLADDILSLQDNIRLAFVDIGVKLQEIYDNRLWGSRYESFEACIKHMFGFSLRHANRTMAAAKVYQEVSKENLLEGYETQITERHMRPLTRVSLETKDRCEIVRDAVSAANGKLTSKNIEQACKSWQENHQAEKNLVPLEENSFAEVYLRSDRWDFPDLKKYNKKIVKIIEVKKGEAENLYVCSSLFGDLLPFLYRDELLSTSAGEELSMSVKLPVQLWSIAGRYGDDPAQVVEKLISICETKQHEN